MVGDFIEIEDIGSVKSVVSEESVQYQSGSCDVLASQEYQFLYSYFGEFSNAQAKIVATTGRNIRTVIQHTLSDPYFMILQTMTVTFSCSTCPSSFSACIFFIILFSSVHVSS